MRVHYENSTVFLLRCVFIEYFGMRAHESWIEAHNLFVKSLRCACDNIQLTALLTIFTMQEEHLLLIGS